MQTSRSKEKAPAGDPTVSAVGDEGLHKSNTHEGIAMSDHTEPARKTITSFSGVFDFSPRILDQIDQMEDYECEADQIVWNIENGFCPRCEGRLPSPPEFPAGSRVTDCRSIPICGPCGSDELFEPAHPADWPLFQEDIDARREKMMANVVPMKLNMVDGELKLLTEDGVADVQSGPSAGGWAEYGRREGTFDA